MNSPGIEELVVDKKEFAMARKRLGKTQKQMANLLGTSVKTVSSYEQGWRTVPVHVERQIYFLISSKRGIAENVDPCWVVKNCPEERRKCCPAWEFNAGKLCWFISGTICECNERKNWTEKMKICKNCRVLGSLLNAG